MSIKRETIVQAMKTRFAAITTTGGYHNTLTSKVTIHSRVPVQSGTAVDIRDLDEALEGDLNGIYWDRRLTVEVGLVCDTSTSDTVLRSLLEDLWKSVGTDVTWSGNAVDTRPVTSEIEVDHEERRIAGGKITLEILYRTSAWAES